MNRTARPEQHPDHEPTTEFQRRTALRDRAACALRDSGFSVREIAAVLNTSPSNVQRVTRTERND